MAPYEIFDNLYQRFSAINFATMAEKGQFTQAIRYFDDQKIYLQNPIAMWYGMRPAAIRGNVPLLKHLIQNKMDVNYNVLSNGETALYLAAQSGHLNAVRFLYEQGADMFISREYTVQQQDGTFKTYRENALDVAKRMGHTAVFQFLDSHKGVKVVASNGKNQANLTSPSHKAKTDEQLLYNKAMRVVTKLTKNTYTVNKLLLIAELCDIMNSFSYQQSISFYRKVVSNIDKEVRQKMETVIREQRQRS